MQLTPEQIQTIVDFLKSKMKLRLLILYGSYASGHATEKSDIDLAFFADDEVDALESNFYWASELASLMHVESTDLVNLQTVDTVFRFVIVSTGRVIFQQGNFDKYLDLAYTRYLQLNDDRREIIDHFQEWFSNGT